MLTLLQHRHYSKDNGNQLGSIEGTFIFLVSVISFSASNIILEVN